MSEHTLSFERYCPACAMQRRAQGIQVATLAWQLCGEHLARLVAALHNPDPAVSDGTVMLFFAHYAKEQRVE